MLGLKELKVGDWIEARAEAGLAAQGMQPGEVWKIQNQSINWDRNNSGWLDYLTARKLDLNAGMGPARGFTVRSGVPGFILLDGERKAKIELVVKEFLRKEPGRPVVMEKANGISGSDPEMFLEDARGKVIPAWEVLREKEVARKDGHPNFPYWDGFQAEIAVNPQTCHAQLMDEVFQGMRKLLMETRAKRPDARISLRNVVDVEKELLETLPEKYVALGCSPSENAYGLKPLDLGDGRVLPFRSAGGHVHYQVNGLTPHLAEHMVKACDMVAGIPSLLMFQKMDDPRRRKIYGLPGEYRLPSWGVEYRVLSSAWLAHPAVAHLVFSLVRLGLKVGLMELEDVFEYDPEAVPRIILENDLDAARKHVERNLGRYKQFLHEIAVRGCADNSWSSGADKVRDAALDALLRPVGDFVPLESVERNWKLDGVEGAWTRNSSGAGCCWSSLILGQDRSERNTAI